MGFDRYLLAVAWVWRHWLFVERPVLPCLALERAGRFDVGFSSPSWSCHASDLSSDFFFNFRLDALSAIFLFLLGMASFGVSIYAIGYFRRTPETPSPHFVICYHLFLAAMVFVLLANDAYTFLFSWEIMAVSSYFLVTTDHRIEEIRKAGFLYLLIAHLGAFAILLAFAILGQGNPYFEAMRASNHTMVATSMAFLLAVVGFGAKAGVLPLHVWLPEAHPAAPSPISALMSGVMLKTALYGLLRFSFDLLPWQAWWWGFSF